MEDKVNLGSDVLLSYVAEFGDILKLNLSSL